MAVAHWLEVFAWTGLVLGFASSLLVAWDIFARGYRQQMGIMDAVWPITALYFGPVGIWAYLRLGRPRSQKATNPPGDVPAWHSGVLSASHCGAGCVLGDIAGGWIVYAAGLTIGGEAIYPEYAFELGLAWIAGIAFQYWAIKPMHPNMRPTEALGDAVKADTLSILAFELGMFAWMALAKWVLDTLPPADDPVHWLMMQIGLVLGFFTTYPVNRWLVRIGVKGGM
jgi:hypothetical protein